MNKQTAAASLSIWVLVLFLGFAFGPVDAQDVCVVTVVSDSGAGSLRSCLEGSASQITFDPAVFPPQQPVAINLADPLPPITRSLTIDASNAGVILDGSAVGRVMKSGLVIQANQVTVWGLQIVNFTGNGIEIQSQGNIIGGDRQVGTGLLGLGNLLSGNGQSGIILSGLSARDNIIQGNLIGVDITGLQAWPNAGDGVSINGANHNQITGNVLSGNGGSGISLCCTADSAYNTISHNMIGVGIDGQQPLPQPVKGVWIYSGSHDNVVGPGNVIAYNGQGVMISDTRSPGNTITGNSIHDNYENGLILWNENLGLLDPPGIASFDWQQGTVAGVACPNCVVEIFTDEDNEGRVHEGQVVADAAGAFSFAKGSAFTAPHITATATDATGTTSVFSAPTVGARSIPIQENNLHPFALIPHQPSHELADNRIAFYIQAQDWVDAGIADANVLNLMGVKRARGQMNDADSYLVNWETSELVIHENFDRMITGLAENDIRMIYNLLFWDKEYYRQNGQIAVPRFQTGDEIERYLDFVRLIMRNFGDRVDTYELWNEPSFEGSYQWIRVEDYINLAKRVIPVIREEDPGARVAVGSFHGWHDRYYEQYLYRILESDLMPMVDMVTWHPYLGILMDDNCGGEFYTRYPQILQEIKTIATEHGFRGEFSADELAFPTRTGYNTGACAAFDRTAAKHYVRAILQHLGEDVSVGILLNGDTQVLVIRSLSTLLAGAQVEAFPVEFDTAADVQSYGFVLPNGERLLAMWNEVDIVDEEAGVSVTIRLPGFADYSAEGIDVLMGVRQNLVASVEGNDLVISDLWIKDYPILVRLMPN